MRDAEQRRTEAAATLVPAALHGFAVELTEAQWPAATRSDFPWTGRGAETQCKAGTTSIPYNASWASASNMPASPVPGLAGAAKIPVTLIPYGATNLRISEIPTTTMEDEEETKKTGGGLR